MKPIYTFTFLAILLHFNHSLSQAFTNGDLNGTVGASSLPTGWQFIPFTDPASQALSPAQATSDLFDATGPNLTAGLNGNPYWGATLCSGLHESGLSGAYIWHEGIMQTVNGFTIGNSYTICFYQAVVKQDNALDQSGTWRVYADNALIGISAPSTSTLAFNSNALVWDLRTIAFTATATSHLIKFLVFDDDANIVSSNADITGGLRMGIDLISFDNASPSPIISPAGPFCHADPSVSLTASILGGVWSGTGITNPTTGEFDPSVAGIGTHSITYEIPSGCIGTVSGNITIIVTNSADASWTNPDTICESGGIIDLTTLITGTVGGSWSGTGVSGTNFDPSGLSGPPIAISYTVGTVPCDSTLQQNITVMGVVDPSWVAPTGLCSFSPLFDLNSAVTGTTGGTWSGTGVSGSDFDPASGTQTITYTVGSGSCQEQLPLTITVGIGENPAWTTLTMCASDAPIDLNGTITGDTGGTWSGTGIATSVFDPSFGTQLITYTVGPLGCETTNTQIITVIDPQVTITETPISCFGLLDGSAIANVTGGSGSETYSWSTVPIQTTANATNLDQGTYTVTVTDGPCTITGDATIQSPPEITASLIGTNGCLPDLGSASIAIAGGAGGYTYSWNNTTQTTATVTDLDSAMHTVTVTDGNGCTYVDSTLIQIFPSPKAQFMATPNVLPIAEPETQFNNGSINSDEWEWDFGDNSPGSIAENPTHTYPNAEPGTYDVELVAYNYGKMCSDTARGLIEVQDILLFYIPNIFTPDGDLFNETWKPIFYSGYDPFDFHLMVFNRWGELIWESYDATYGWNGHYANGDIVQDGTYIWMIDFAETMSDKRHLHRGHLTVLK